MLSLHAREPSLKLGGTCGICERGMASSPSSTSKRFNAEVFLLPSEENVINICMIDCVGVVFESTCKREVRKTFVNCPTCLSPICWNESKRVRRVNTSQKPYVSITEQQRRVKQN